MREHAIVYLLCCITFSALSISIYLPYILGEQAVFRSVHRSSFVTAALRRWDGAAFAAAWLARLVWAGDARVLSLEHHYRHRHSRRLRVRSSG